MKKDLLKFFTLLLAGLPLVLLSACGGGGGSSSTSASTGTISVGVTDADVLYDQVVLKITEVGAVSDDETVYYNASVLDWLPVQVDVLDYPDQKSFHLADIQVPLPEDGSPVCLHQIRFVVEENPQNCDGAGCNNYVTVGGTSYAMDTPSGAQSGIKVKAPSEFCVSSGQTFVELTLDIDPATAILSQPQNRYKLKPTQIRIIEGTWSEQASPESFVQGTVAVPTYNTAGVCEEYDTIPVVTVGAYATGASEPASQTVSLAEGNDGIPFKAAEVCAARCSAEPDPAACEAVCLAELNANGADNCYYTGNFKLLLPDTGEYDLGANWDNFSATVPYNAAVYNSAVFVELSPNL